MTRPPSFLASKYTLGPDGQVFTNLSDDEDDDDEHADSFYQNDGDGYGTADDTFDTLKSKSVDEYSAGSLFSDDDNDSYLPGLKGVPVTDWSPFRQTLTARSFGRARS